MNGFHYLPFMSLQQVKGEISQSVLEQIRKKQGPDGVEAVQAFTREFSLSGWTPPVMDKGNFREFRNMMFRAEGEDRIAVFDYSYTTGTGRDQNINSKAIAMFRDMGVAFPGFDLGPEGYADKFFSLLGLGFQDIDFTDTTGFSEQYLLRGGDEKAIRGLFDMDLRMRVARLNGISVQAMGEFFLFFRHQKMYDLPELGGFIQEASGMHAEFLRRVSG
jgi:hypothetical protein